MLAATTILEWIMWVIVEVLLLRRLGRAPPPALSASAVEMRESRTTMKIMAMTDSPKSSEADPSRLKPEGFVMLAHSIKEIQISTRLLQEPGIALALGQDKLKSDG
jgi:hypothetical protein